MTTMSTVRINEYYDVFNVKAQELKQRDALTADNVIADTNMTNPFRGFWNSTNYATAQQAYDNIVIHEQHFAPREINTLDIDENGDIYCYPPNASVPYWDKVIFRNFDYTVQPHGLTSGSTAEAYAQMIDNAYLWHSEREPTIYWAADGDDSAARAANWAKYIVKPTDWHGNYILGGPSNNLQQVQPDPSFNEIFSNIKTTFKNYDQVPLFLKFDQYTSRSKVIFSSCDKTRNPDIEFIFGYQHGNMTPLKMNLSLTASQPFKEFNHNLTKADIQQLLVKCYWCIEWVHYPKMNTDV